MSLFTGKAVRTIERYIAALNAHDMVELAQMIDEDACFVDSCGDAVDGRDVICALMDQFFKLEPGFKLNATEISEFRGDVLIRGSVEARDPQLANDSLWRARVEQNKVTFWQSYADGPSLAITRTLAPEMVRRIPIGA